MIEGVVTAAYEPVITLAVLGPSGRSTEIEAVVDTGFNGLLTVTPALARELGLTLEGTGLATLADGSEVTFDLYEVGVLWDGQPKYVVAEEAETTPLVGMLLLDRYSLSVEVEAGGRVVIQARE